MFFYILMSTHPFTHTFRRTPPTSRCTLDSYLCNMCPMSVGHLICCRKATAQILFFRVCPYPFRNFDSGLENTPSPLLHRQKESAGHSRRRKSIFRLIWNPDCPTGCTVPHLHHGCGDASIQPLRPFLVSFRGTWSEEEVLSAFSDFGRVLVL